MTDREAMKQALEALENGDVPTPENVGKNLDAITALRERLAQPEQEPVAWVKQSGELVVRTDYGGRLYYSDQSVYTTPPQRKPLTDKELEQVFPAIATYHEANKTLYRSIARAIEAAHGIKENT